MTTETVAGLYDTYADAAQSVREIEAIGILRDNLSVVASAIGSGYAAAEESHAGPDAAIGTGVGAIVGGVAGLGLLAIPGVGPVVAAGWLVATAVGAVAGAGAGGVAGGIIGALTGSGVSSEHANVYAEGIRRGGTLVTARVYDHQAAAVEEIMRRNHVVDPVSRAATGGEFRRESFAAAPERQQARNLTPAA